MMQLIKDLWHGDISMGETFWLFGFLGSFIFFCALKYFSDNPVILTSKIDWILFWVMVVIGLIYRGFILIAIWRSANKYKGPLYWAILAKIAVISGWGLYLKDVTEIIALVF
ncbi:MAG: hypothetical protein ABSB32_17640 [Thermodesulfobacteriota bacterium]|jgi:hypothetical protein